MNSWSGFVKLISSSLQFAEGNANPSVTQEVFNTGGTGVPAQNLTIAAQANANGPGGNLLLNAGVGDSGGSLGSINLYTQTLLFNEAMPGVVAYLIYCYIVIERMRSPLWLCWGSEFVYWISLLLASFIYLRSGRWKGKSI